MIYEPLTQHLVPIRMTKIDLFRVIIKIFGIYCLMKAMFRLLPSGPVLDGFDSFSFIFNLIYMIVMGLISLLFLSQTDRLIKFFRLEKGLIRRTLI